MYHFLAEKKIGMVSKPSLKYLYALAFNFHPQLFVHPQNF